MASSTGGADVVAAVLRELDCAEHGPVVLAHHLEPNFVTIFARWLHEQSHWPVVVVNGRQPLVDGTVFVAAGGCDLVVEPGEVVALRAESAFVPCADRLLASVAHAYGLHSTGIVFSGMGHDGSAGLKAIVAAGGRAYCQDPATALVASMPLAALEAAANARSLSVPGLVAVLKPPLHSDAV